MRGRSERTGCQDPTRPSINLPAGWVADAADHLTVASATAASGWPVFPVLATKRPASRNGFLDATTDHQRIERWWRRHPDHLIGVPTAGLVVVDLDHRPPAPCSWAWWQDTCDTHDWDIATNLVVATPGNGCHVYFDAPVEVRNKANILGGGDDTPFVDCRGTGGYIIAAGSRLPDGRCYEVINYVVALPEAPTWLVELVCPPRPVPETTDRLSGVPTNGTTRYGEAALERECGKLAVAHNGCRNDTLVKAAFRLGQLVPGGHLEASVVADALHAVAVRTGLGDFEAERTIRSGLEAGFAQPREVR